MSDQRLLSLRDQITEEAPWLFSALGLSIVGEDFQPKSFGNSFVTLEGASIRVRFVRDRGQVWVDVAPRNTRNKWWHLLFVLEAVRGQLPEANYTLKHATTLLYDNFGELVESLGPNWQKTESELRRREAERLDAYRSRKPKDQ
jgi:hypothetical protein